MNQRLHPLAIPLMLMLAACRAAVAEYSEAEAPNQLAVSSAASAVDVRFLRHSDRLVPGDAARLAQLAMNGDIKRSDQVTVSLSGAGPLAERRAAAVARELLHYGIAASVRPLADIAPDTARVGIGRYLVTLPPCPNWSKPPANDFTNAVSSNLGCATASNLGLMVAYPVDLVSPRALGPADGQPAAAAVNRYLNDKVQLPSQNQALPLATSGAGPAAGGGAPTAGGS